MIRLFNSMTQGKEDFVPRSTGQVGIYCCGPTVYGLVHIGNARPYITFAVLRSWLRHRGLSVTLVENITDVDDKIIARAQKEHRRPHDVADEFTRAYHEDVGRLGAELAPDVEPKATETIAEIIDLCCSLIEKEHAYEAHGSVYFSVRSFVAYGKLSGQRIEELEEGVRIVNEPGKRDPLDFAIWKAAKEGEPSWDSPWGQGRPGWHIECSAMGLRFLGPGFDIHGGGRDLIFPHHENEIAQSEAAGLPFARLWMHNGMIRSDGQKMAKSVGNIFLLREVLDRYADAAHGDAPVVLMYFLTTHYRSPLEFSTDKLDEARAQYDRLAGFIRDVDFRTSHAGLAGEAGHAADVRARITETRQRFAEHMDDDLNTAGALGELFSLVGELYRYMTRIDAGQAPLDATALRTARAEIAELASVLLIRLPQPEETDETAAEDGAACATGELALPSARRLAEEDRWDDVALLYRERLQCSDPTYAVVLRDHYRAERDWAKSDELRDELQSAGFEVRDTKLGTQVVPRG